MNTMTDTTLAALAAGGKHREIEERWMAMVEQGARDLRDFRIAARHLVQAGKPDVAGSLLSVLLEQLAKSEPDAEVIEFAGQALLLALQDKQLRRHAAAIHLRGGRPETAVLLEPLEKGHGDVLHERVRKVLQLRPGTFVMGSVRVGPERVVQFEMGARCFILNDGESDRSLAPDEAAQELTLLPPDHFRALLRFDVEQLVKLANDDPAGLVVSALRANKGRLEWSELKKLMARGIVPQTAFARWWNKAKGFVDRNPMIQVYGEKQPSLLLRTDPISHEEEIGGKLKRAAKPKDKIEYVLGYLHSLDEGHALNADFLSELAGVLADLANDPATDAASALAAASVHEEVAARATGAAVKPVDYAALLGRPEGFNDVAASLPDEELQRRALFLLRERGSEAWPKAFAAALPSSPGRLTDMLARELLAEGKGDALAAAVQAILANPDRYGDGLFWLWKTATTGGLDKAPCRIDNIAITLAFLRLVNRWARSAKTQVTDAQRALLAKMRGAVGASSYRSMNSVLDALTESQAIAMYHEVKDNQGITDAARHYLSEQLKARFVDAIVGRKELWQEDVIYVSPRGLRQRQSEFDKIVNIDMVKNSEAIGHAAGFGDLSENAEFTAALEQRDFLSRRANEIGDEIKKAKPIPIGKITKAMANVGTKVTVKDLANGKVQEFTFLGPWDVDLDRGIYSYLAPFSLQFLGHKVGDIIELGSEGSGTKPQKFELLQIDLADIPQ